MSLPVTNSTSPDVLEGREPAAGRTWRVPWFLVGGGLALALVSGVAFLGAQDEGATVVDASGSMVLNEGYARVLAVPHSTQEEGRDSVWTGTIRLDLPDGRLDGTAATRGSWAGTAEGDLIMISHNWGQLDVTFESTTCSGPYAWSSYREPRETGGSMSLRCDDGSLFTANLLLKRDEDATADHPFRILMTLEDGSYVPG